MTKLPMPKGGRPRGSRNRLQSSFIHELAEDFEKHGAAAIRICRVEQPETYLKIIASILPRDIIFESSLGEIDDDGLDDLILQMRQRLIETRQQQPPMTLIAQDMAIEKVANGGK